MWLTAEQRQAMLKLFNVAEAARKIGVPVDDLYYQLRIGRLPKPQVQCGIRTYYTADDLQMLEEKWEEMQNRP